MMHAYQLLDGHTLASAAVQPYAQAAAGCGAVHSLAGINGHGIQQPGGHRSAWIWPHTNRG